MRKPSLVNYWHTCLEVLIHKSKIQREEKCNAKLYIHISWKEQYPKRRKGNKSVVILWNRSPSKSCRSEIATFQGCKGWLLSRRVCVFPAAVAPFFMPIFLRRHDFRQLYRSPVEACWARAGKQSKTRAGRHTHTGRENKTCVECTTRFYAHKSGLSFRAHLNPAPRASPSGSITATIFHLCAHNSIKRPWFPSAPIPGSPFSIHSRWVVECQTKNDVRTLHL